MDDLIGVCTGCDGTGKRTESETRKTGSGFGRQTVTYRIGDQPEDCPKCVGTGRWGLTETGKVVHDFMVLAEKLATRGLNG